MQHCCHVEIWMRVYFMASRCFLRKSSLFEKWTDDFSGGIFYIYARAYICRMSSELGFGVLGFPVARVYARALWMSTVLGFGKIIRFSDCMFLICLQWLKATVPEGIKRGCFLVGPGPVFLVVLLDLRRNANLAGGFAGRLVLVVRFVYVYLICLRSWYWPIVLSITFFTAYVSIRTVPQSIYGQTRGKKKFSKKHSGKCHCVPRQIHLWVLLFGPFLFALLFLWRNAGDLRVVLVFCFSYVLLLFRFAVFIRAKLFLSGNSKERAFERFCQHRF